MTAQGWVIHGVRTLEPTAFDAACAELRQLIVDGGRPDVLVGIRTGGLVVATNLARDALADVPVLPLTCRRSGTAAKQRMSGDTRLLARLPRPVRDRLRLVEHRVVTSRRAPASSGAREVDPTELASLRTWCADRRAGARILVVDDAVDTGATLAHVLGAVRSVASPGSTIRTAAITVTTALPAAAPDVVLFHGWLCRFPWSLDA